VTSLGEQPHDAAGCHWGGRPHPGACRDRGQESGYSLTEIRTVLSRARTALRLLSDTLPIEWHRLPKQPDPPGVTGNGAPPHDRSRGRFHDPDLLLMRAALAHVVTLLEPWDRTGTAKRWVTPDEPSQLLHDGPAEVYEFADTDEMTLAELAVLAEVRRRLSAEYLPAAVALVDAYARDLVDENREDDEGDEG